eukprot:1590283-Rhodomonas_salina.1
MSGTDSSMACPRCGGVRPTSTTRCRSASLPFMDAPPSKLLTVLPFLEAILTLMAGAAAGRGGRGPRARGRPRTSPLYAYAAARPCPTLTVRHRPARSCRRHVTRSSARRTRVAGSYRCVLAYSATKVRCTEVACDALRGPEPLSARVEALLWACCQAGEVSSAIPLRAARYFRSVCQYHDSVRTKPTVEAVYGSDIGHRSSRGR